MTTRRVSSATSGHAEHMTAVTTPLPAMAARGCHGFGTLDGDGALTIYLHDAATPAQQAAAAAIPEPP